MTDEHLTGSDRVQRLQTVLYEEAQWFCCKDKVRTGRYVRFSDANLWEIHGLQRLVPTTKDLPWAKS